MFSRPRSCKIRKVGQSSGTVGIFQTFYRFDKYLGETTKERTTLSWFVALKVSVLDYLALSLGPSEEHGGGEGPVE